VRVTKAEAAAIRHQTSAGFREWAKRRGDQPPHWAAKRRDRRVEGADSGQEAKTRPRAIQGPAKGKGAGPLYSDVGSVIGRKESFRGGKRGHQGTRLVKSNTRPKIHGKPTGRKTS
jgi:hypothetical protein